VANDLAVYEAIAAALAGGHEPDLSAFEPADVRAALERALGSPPARREFVAWLDNRVRALSADITSIEERSVENGPPRELPLRRIVQGEPFAEPVVVQADAPAVRFPMRG